MVLNTILPPLSYRLSHFTLLHCQPELSSLGFVASSIVSELADVMATVSFIATKPPELWLIGSVASFIKLIHEQSELRTCE